MFCNNCGNRVPDGSNFCSACGARLAVAVETPAVEPVELPNMQERNKDFSFDWSGVKDEPHKKEVREVASPWGSTGMNTETVVEEAGEQRSRTMSFIDILKKEREEKARAAEVETMETLEEVPAPKHAAPSEMPSFYQPPMYDDLDSHTVTPFDSTEEEEPSYEAPSFEEPVYEEPIYNSSVFETEEPTIILDGSEFVHSDYEEDNKARLDAELAAILDAGSGNLAGEEDDSVDLFEDTEEIEFPTLNSEVEEEPVISFEPEIEEIEEPEEIKAVSDETSGLFDYEALIAELSDIAGSEPTEVLLSDYIDEPEEFVEQESADEEYIPSHGASYEEPEEELDEIEPEVPELDEVKPEEELDEVEPEEPVLDETEPEVEDFVEYTYEEESPVEEKDAEIDALKKRLAELMGDSTEEVPAYEEPVYEESLPTEEEENETVEELEEDQPFFESIGIEIPAVEDNIEEEVEEPVVEELPLIDPTPEAEEVLPLINEEHEEAVIAEEKEEIVEDDSTDAMSVEELEKDLFGVVPDDEAEAEATKKIDKFYTLYKKNEEFQRLLDEEYNKLKNEEVVPTVSAILGEEEKAVAEAAEEVVETAENAVETAPEKTTETVEAVKEEVAEVTETVEPVAEVVSAVETVAKEDAASDEEASSKGGTALTVIAVIVAVLLVILLAVILVLNFAPDSAIALKLDSVIETITSYFSAVEVPGKFLL